jgi:hypothetical protein
MTRYKSYAEKLRDPRWQKKRLEILERDEWKCYRCEASDDTLAVHHLLYTKGQAPWEADSDTLITLCSCCHDKASAFQTWCARLPLELNRIDMSEEDCRAIIEAVLFSEEAMQITTVTLRAVLDSGGVDILRNLVDMAETLDYLSWNRGYNHAKTKKVVES